MNGVQLATVRSKAQKEIEMNADERSHERGAGYSCEKPFTVGIGPRACPITYMHTRSISTSEFIVGIGP